MGQGKASEVTTRRTSWRGIKNTPGGSAGGVGRASNSGTYPRDDGPRAASGFGLHIIMAIIAREAITISMRQSLAAKGQSVKGYSENAHLFLFPLKAEQRAENRSTL